MSETVEQVQGWIVHWPWFAAGLIFWAIGNATKRVITREMACRWRVAWIFRATMPMHAALAGLFAGACFASLPVSPGVVGPEARALYFASAGVCCHWIFDFVRYWAKMRGITLTDGTSVPPDAKP